jgi:hypothetical protein
MHVRRTQFLSPSTTIKQHDYYYITREQIQNFPTHSFSFSGPVAWPTCVARYRAKGNTFPCFIKLVHLVQNPHNNWRDWMLFMSPWRLWKILSQPVRRLYHRVCRWGTPDMAGLGSVKVYWIVRPVRENLYFTHVQERTSGGLGKTGAVNIHCSMCGVFQTSLPTEGLYWLVQNCYWRRPIDVL